MTNTTRCCMLLALLLSACTPHPLMMTAVPDPAPHPLSGRIWDTRTQRWVATPELEQHLNSVRFVLLGEVHDNPVHHRLRRDLIAALIRDGRRPAIAMEQFDREHQAALQQAQREPAPTPESLKNAGRLDATGWHWPFYEPIVRLALDHRLTVHAANLSRTDAFRVSTQGAAVVLGAATFRALKLDVPLPEAARHSLEQIIKEGHCNQAPPEILPGIVSAQRARDAVMAGVLRGAGDGGAVLIAGNGHVRRDFGVPHYLAQYPQGRDALVVAYLEVDAVRTAPADYFNVAAPEYDYIVFTPQTPRPDPCKDIRFKDR